MISVHQCFYMFLFKCYLTVPVFWWLAECFNCMAAIVVSALKWRSLLAKPAALVQTVVQPMGTRWHLSTFVIFSSSLIITLLLQKRTVKEWQGGRERRKQFLQNKTTELSQDHKDTQQELPFSQSKIHTRTRMFFLHPKVNSLYIFCCVVWFWGGICLVWRCFGASCCFGSCVVLQQQRRQQPEQARKLHFRETKKRKKKEMRRWQKRRWRREGGEDTMVSTFVSVFSEGLSTNWTWEGEGKRGGQEKGGKWDRDIKGDKEVIIEKATGKQEKWTMGWSQNGGK